MKFSNALILLLVIIAIGFATNDSHAQGVDTAKRQRATAAEARTILAKMKAKLADTRTLTVDYELNAEARRFFTRQGELLLERPNRYRMEDITGLTTEQRN